MTNFQFLGVSSQAEDEEEEDQPLSLSWPESNRKRFTYLLIIPIVLPLWLTLPDVRKTVREAELVPLTTTQNKIVMCFFSVFSVFVIFTNCSLLFSLFQSSKKFFPVTFLGAICWIACFSYLMVWWAHQVYIHFIKGSFPPRDVTL